MIGLPSCWRSCNLDSHRGLKMNERRQEVCVKILFVGYLIGSAIVIALEQKIMLAIAGAGAIYIAGSQINKRLACKMTACILVSDVIVYFLSR